MPKYVCDVDAVTTIGNEVIAAAGELDTSIGNYNSKITSDLSSWDGNAKNSFNTANTTQVETAKADSQYINELGTFIVDAAKKIDEVEQQLAAQTI